MRPISIYTLLSTVICVAILPLLWGMSTALKHKSEIEAYPPTLFPNPPTLENFQSVVAETGVQQQFLNSTLVGLVTALIGVVIAAHAAYALSRFNFPAKRLIAVAILMTSMVPEICVLIPLYYLASVTKIYDTYGVLVLVYSALQVPTIMWFLRGFFDSVPRELDESALIDGCTPWSAFYRIILPISRPGLAAAGLLVFIFVWNDFLIAFTLTISDSHRMLGVGLYQYISQYGVEWGSLMAAVMLALCPVLIVFLVLQRLFVSGLTAGAMKG